MYPNDGAKPFPYGAGHKDCTGGLVITMFYSYILSNAFLKSMKISKRSC